MRFQIVERKNGEENTERDTSKGVKGIDHLEDEWKRIRS
jgi:hypothetical protein